MFLPFMEIAVCATRGPTNACYRALTRIMPKFSTAAAKSSVLPALRDPQAGAWGTRLRVTQRWQDGAFTPS